MLRPLALLLSFLLLAGRAEAGPAGSAPACDLGRGSALVELSCELARGLGARAAGALVAAVTPEADPSIEVKPELGTRLAGLIAGAIGRGATAWPTADSAPRIRALARGSRPLVVVTTKVLVGLPCEGVTTPGGFGGRSLVSLSKATLASCRDVFKAEIPHYIRHLYDRGDASVAPRVEYAEGLDGDDPKCAVSIIGCTGDWTGGWDCSDRGFVDRFITPDLKRGRMVDVIERGEPACIVCHWTGIYFNGEEVGFNVFQDAVRRLHARYDLLQWMKLSEIARYWAANELTTIV
jgi:hypothetical protein